MPWKTSPIEKPTQPMAFSDDKIRFVWATDIHITEHTGTPANNLRLAIEDCNLWLPNAMVMTGDIGDVTYIYLWRAFYLLWSCQRPVRLAVGNHDETENTLGAGHPYTAAIESEQAINRPAPFYWSEHWSSGDGTFTALVMYLDGNFYADDPDGGEPGNSPDHNPGDRIGFLTGTPAGGYWAQYPQTELDWITATLAADTTSQAVLIFTHYEPGASRVTNFTALADALQSDPLARPLIIFSGHNHDDARIQTLLKTTDNATFTTYKAPAMLESGAWTRVTLGWDGSSITIDGMVVYNYTDPGGWTINSPFTLAS